MVYFVQSSQMINGGACESAKTRGQKVFEISESFEM